MFFFCFLRFTKGKPNRQCKSSVKYHSIVCLLTVVAEVTMVLLEGDSDDVSGGRLVGR